MRRKREDHSGIPADLGDPASWERCIRFDGGTQPCSCSWARRQQQWIAAGGPWPDGEIGSLRDYLAAVQRHPCNAPFDPSTI